MTGIAHYDGHAEWFDEFTTAAFAELGWSVTGVDVSEDQLSPARKRDVDVALADVAVLPFADASFDAAVSMWTHTDLEEPGDREYPYQLALRWRR